MKAHQVSQITGHPLSEVPNVQSQDNSFFLSQDRFSESPALENYLRCQSTVNRVVGTRKSNENYKTRGLEERLSTIERKIELLSVKIDEIASNPARVTYNSDSQIYSLEKKY